MCLKQIAKTVAADSRAKKEFAKREGLKYVMKIKHDTNGADSNVRKAAEDVLVVYPEELVKIHMPGYEELLMKKLDDFQAID